MNLENLSKPELLMFFSVLEGELEARDVVIEALQAQHRDRFIQERYGKYDISDPFLALQRDCESVRDGNRGDKQPVCTNPLSVLKVVMTQCKTMQERMVSQLAAAESRHRKVILDLEEERRRHAQDTAEGDDVTYMLEKERERLTQQLEFEKSQVKKVEKEQKKLSTQLEEERTRHKQLTTVLMKECKKATNKAAEEVQKTTELKLRLEKEMSRSSEWEEELATEKRRALQREAQMEKQLSEFDTEKEQLRARLNREENRARALSEEVEHLKQVIEELKNGTENSSKVVANEPKSPVALSVEAGSNKSKSVSPSCQTDCSHVKVSNGGDVKERHCTSSTPSILVPQLNGHCSAFMLDNADGQSTDGNGADSLCSGENKLASPCPGHIVENGSANVASCAAPHFTGGTSLSPCNTVNSSAASSVTSSPCSSPVLTKRLTSSTSPSSSFQSSYQAGLNQRFHAARFKFQAQAEQDQQTGVLQSPPPRDLSPTTSDSSAAKQLARNTVTQVLSRFTNQPGTLKTANNSPFGTDYRQLGSSPKTPTGDASHSPTSSKVSSPQGPLAPGIKSPTISRVDRGNPPPIPPKKPGLAQSPASPHPLARAAADSGPSQIGPSAKNESGASNSVQPQRFFNWRETGIHEEVASKSSLERGATIGCEDGTEGTVHVVPVGTLSNEPNPTGPLKLSTVSTDVCGTTVDLPNTCGMNNSLITPSSKEIDILLPTSS
ncbi:CTTNBP2 N-terminal like b isoform X2 [Carcharodon carcharias]|uniref:CTTNBP2 N-terminal like b isoform X2 n=1 Tax=Carcharodon carcharias TaxID=13397 RepID=UPI001B7D9265|nr:CTTNBP2 N-terminal like b isoform X2 [Carcharodon carcharias]